MKPNVLISCNSTDGLDSSSGSADSRRVNCPEEGFWGSGARWVERRPDSDEVGSSYCAA